MSEPTCTDQSRRDFLRVSALGTGMVISLSVPGFGLSQARAQTTASAFSPNAWVAIDAAGVVKITVAKSDMGQGVRTSLAMLVAEELDADWEKVVVVQANNDAAKYGRQGTGGSGSVRDGWIPLRKAGATARQMLMRAAANRWRVEPALLRCNKGSVYLDEKNLSLGYGELAAEAAMLTVPAEVALKDKANFTLIGKSTANVDLDDILSGKPRYGLDVRLPGMKYAVLARSPKRFGKVVSFNSERALAVRGVSQVFEIPSVGNGVNTNAAVAVVANDSWSAMQGRKELDIVWDFSASKAEHSTQHSQSMRQAVVGADLQVINQTGDALIKLEKSENSHQATYEVPLISHATMEPMNSTAWVKGEVCEIHSPTQFPNWAARAVAAAIGIDAANVKVNITLMGGGFGRRINPDHVVEAALVAKQVDAPVQVLWTRTDDLHHDFFRPPAVHELRAAISANGYPEAWASRSSTAAISSSLSGTYDPKHGAAELTGLGDSFYRVPHRLTQYAHLDSNVKRGWWRAVHTTHTTFAVESFIDELAEKAGIDALQFRLALIDKVTVDEPQQDDKFPFQPERMKAVLKLAAKKAGWGGKSRPRTALGMACAIDHVSYAASVIELAVSKAGKLDIKKVVCVADCGPVVNPVNARAQLEGGIIMGLSAALHEQITLANGEVQQSNFDRYELLRIDEAPGRIETYFVVGDERPTGLGEPSVPTIAPALANAIYRATGKRLRNLPLQV